MKLWNKSSNLWKHFIYQSMSLFNQVKEKNPPPKRNVFEIENLFKCTAQNVKLPAMWNQSYCINRKVTDQENYSSYSDQMKTKKSREVWCSTAPVWRNIWKVECPLVIVSLLALANLIWSSTQPKVLLQREGWVENHSEVKMMMRKDKKKLWESLWPNRR